MPDSNRHQFLFSVPPLPTLHLQASWENRAGRVDRSACLALNVNRLWRRIEPEGWKKLCSGDPARAAWAAIAVHAADLLALRRRRGARILAGDLRTTKSNVMRCHALPLPMGEGGGEGAREGGDAFDLRRPPPRPSPRPRKRIHKRAAAPNPNHGATSTKVLGLTRDDGLADDRHDWVQIIRMERWQYPLKPAAREQVNRLSWRPYRGPRAQHFFICPACGSKVRKLFTILATRDELRDARLAESWIAMLDGRYQAARRPLNRDLLILRASLIDRYGVLFRGRRLVCRTCLGIRYGEVKPQWIGTRAADIHAPLRSGRR